MAKRKQQNPAMDDSSDKPRYKHAQQGELDTFIMALDDACRERRHAGDATEYAEQLKAAHAKKVTGFTFLELDNTLIVEPNGLTRDMARLMYEFWALGDEDAQEFVRLLNAREGVEPITLEVLKNPLPEKARTPPTMPVAIEEKSEKLPEEPGREAGTDAGGRGWRDAKQMKEEIAAGRLPAFTALLEDAYKAKLADHKGLININSFLWDDVFPAWRQNGKPLKPEAFCDLIAEFNQGTEGKATLSNKAVYNWKFHPDQMQPNSETMEIFRRAFFKPSLEHEVMLWKIIAGHPFKNPYPASDAPLETADGKSEMDKAIEAAEAAKNHGPLVKALAAASGIPDVRLWKMLGNQQLYQWENGAHIEKKTTAELFLSLMNPESHAAAPEAAQKQNSRMLGMLTGKIFDIPAMLESVRASGVDNPGGALLILLTGGRKGLAPLSAEELAAKMLEKGCEVSASIVKKMRVTGYQRGCTISAERANAIMQIVCEEAKVEIAGEFRRQCVAMLTTNRVERAGEPNFSRQVRGSQLSAIGGEDPPPFP